MKFFLPTGKPVKVVTSTDMVYVDVFATEPDMNVDRAETRYSLESAKITIFHDGIMVRGYENLATGDRSFGLRRFRLYTEKP